MAEKIELEVSLKDLGEQAKKANLTSAQRESYSAHANKAQLALDTKDYKLFQKHFNSMVGILKNAVGASKDVSQALKDAIKIKDDLAKKVNKLRDQQAEIKSTITKEGKLKATKAQSLYSGHERYSKVKDASGKQISNYGTAAENASKITVSAQKITNEIAKAVGFADKASAQAAVAIMKEIEAVRQKAVADQPQVEAKLAEAEQEQAQQTEEVDRLTASSTQSASAITELYKAIDELGTKTNATVTNIRNEEKIAQSGTEAVSEPISTKGIEKQSSSLGKAFKQFTLYAIAVRSAKRALNEAKKTIVDLDKYLTEQAMVTGKTRRETYALLKSYQALAKQLGTTTKEVAEVATQYMRQGKTTEDALKLTEAAVSAAKVAGISAAESVQYLTTALNGFQLSANDAMQVSDKFAAIAAQSASSYEELAIALSKVASQANLAGMSIDYTTALLAKGLETTREAPETIGTALKTVIARMREMGDYGETLEGDTDVNNVETQLAYVNIALKNQNGELRSTEEVLDELGKKWDTLSVNQQAAVAKALAGTRQQSRLIAMMQDYERVTELQEISQRSAGATMAQMETYLQGMDAALNKLNNAWEQIITNITDSDIIINLINVVTGVLDRIGEFLSTAQGVATTLTIISTISLLILGNKMKELRINKQIQQIQVLQNIQEAKKKVQIQQSIIEEKKALKVAQEKLIADLKDARAKAEANGESTTALDAQILQEETKLSQINSEITLEESKLKVYQEQEKSMSAQTGFIGQISSGISGLTAPLFMVIALWKTISGMISIVATKRKALHAQEMSETMAENSVKATSAAGTIISQLGVWGIPIAIAVAAALAGVALAISGAFSSTKETTEDQINALSASIYNLQKTSDTLKSVESKFDAIDNKVIKTNEDLEKMHELLSSAGDVMSTEKGDYDDTVSRLMSEQGWSEKKAKRVLDRAKRRKEKGKKLTGKNAQIAWEAYEQWDGATEQDYYNSLVTDADKRAYLEKKEAETQRKLDEQRAKQLEKITQAINEGASAEQYRAEVTALTNAQIYKQIDALSDLTEEQKKATESIVQNLTDQMSAADQLRYLNHPELLGNLINRVNSATVHTSDGMMSASEVLNSDNYTLAEKVDAFRTISAQLSAEERAAFIAVYKEFSDFVDLVNKSNDKVLDYIDKFGITADKINDLKADLEKVDGNYLEVLKSLTDNTDIETGIVDIQKVIHDNFGDITDDTEKYNQVLNALEKAIGESMLNIGQAMTKTQNQINTVYETALKWSTMSSSDQGSFLSENAELFKNNPELYRAFQTGDLSKIEMALQGSEALQRDIQEKIRTINSQLAIEEARLGEDRNEFMIQYLKDQLEMLTDEENFFKASLDVRIDLEKKQLDIYKEYLKKQQDALTEALDKRKEAYQDYFDKINQEEEDEEYEKQANLLATNLSKLASSDNASSKQQTKELEKQLQELEEERLKELRQRAQEAILQNLDDQVEEINKKFDKLLESNQNLLAAMLNDESNKDDFIANMISSNIEGMTSNEAQKWLSEDFMTTFGSMLPKEALTQIEKSMSEVLNLNVNGGNVTITEDQQKSLYKIIMDALQQIGYN